MRDSQSVRIVTLGCAKNMVDSEVLMGQLKLNNIKILKEQDKGKADTVVINTCGFIHDAKEESIDTILSYVEEKKRGKIKEVYVMGCLSERYKEQLAKEIPEVGQFFGVNDLEFIVKKIGGEYRSKLLCERVLTTPPHYAYLKIAEGCDRSCSFCAIPKIRGPHVSRPMEAILQEAELLAQGGVKELLLVAQDLTYYGIDSDQKKMLPQLVEKLSALKRFDWIRLHYLYPNNFPEELFEIITSHSDVCNYIDIPLQHISDRILKSMRRGVTKEETVRLIEKFRKKLPGAALRTAFIVGYPGETEQEFGELLDFIREVKFDRVGVFTYSEEENTPACKLDDNVPDELKNERAAELMEVQQHIADQLDQQKIGKTFKVLVDRIDGEYFVGRTEFDSPEVDGEVLVPLTENCRIGEFSDIKITSSDNFDLFGVLA